MRNTIQLPLPYNASVCLISARRYGDAVINAVIAKAAAQSRPDIQWVIWTKPEFTTLFQLMGFSNIITSEFPIAGGATKFAKDFGLSLIKAINKLRKLKLDVSIDFIGDSREAACGALITGNSHRSPKWSHSHWMHRLIWNIQIPFVQYVDISSTQEQIYEVITHLLKKLIGTNFEVSNKIRSIHEFPVVAFHPFPSTKFRYWPMQNWQKLGQLLYAKNLAPNIICSTADTPMANHYFQAEKNIKVISCPSIIELVSQLQKIDLLIGVDSFLIHLAHALGVRTISITAGHLPNWWSPRGNIALGQSGGCSNYPCANQPNCIGTSHESQCIKSVEPKQVLEAIEKALSS